MRRGKWEVRAFYIPHVPPPPPCQGWYEYETFTRFICILDHSSNNMQWLVRSSVVLNRSAVNNMYTDMCSPLGAWSRDRWYCVHCFLSSIQTVYSQVDSQTADGSDHSYRLSIHQSTWIHVHTVWSPNFRYFALLAIESSTTHLFQKRSVLFLQQYLLKGKSSSAKCVILSHPSEN